MNGGADQPDGLRPRIDEVGVAHRRVEVDEAAGRPVRVQDLRALEFPPQERDAGRGRLGATDDVGEHLIVVRQDMDRWQSGFFAAGSK